MEKSGRLDLDINEVNGSAKKEPVQPTYKQLPDDDANWQSKNDQEKSDKTPENAMVKQNGADPENDDGAQEKMLQDDTKLTPNKDTTEVKFISENGDAKIDIETVKHALSGMGKEELMKFANDPFWIRLRWFLFIAFWLLWASMLAGAIAIIVMAPKCNPPEPRKWWQESPIIQLDAADTPSQNLKGLETLLDVIKEQGINAISLVSIVKKSTDGHTIDFRDIQPSLGTVSDLEAFIKTANSKGQKVVLELDPNHSSVDHPWFKRSVKKDFNYTSYYIWADPKMENGVRNPPNNWLSTYGESAWEWNDERGQYYLHQFNRTQPELNYTNPAVVNEFGDILTHWLELGVSGFRLDNTQFLIEDPELQDEINSLVGEADSYTSLNHVKTKDRDENKAILRQWRNIVLNYSNGEGFFSRSDDIGADVLQFLHDEKTLIDLPQNSQFLTTADSKISASILNKSISQNLKVFQWPGWDLNGKKRSLRSRVTPGVADSLTLMTLLLPGTPIVKYNDITSAKSEFAEVSKQRSHQAFLYGDTNTHIINNTQVFAYTRLKSGYPGYLVAYNSGNTSAMIDVTTIPHMAKEVTVVAHSPNYAIDGIDATMKKLNSNKVPMARKSTLVVSFVPEHQA